MSAPKEVAAPPVWRSHVFASIFLEPYLDVAESCTGGSTGPLGDAFDFIHALLRDEAGTTDGAIRTAIELCADAKRLHAVCFDSLADQPFLGFLQDLVQRIRALKVGDAVLTPGFWATGSATMFVIGRPARGAGYTLAVCCTGDGARYHPVYPGAIDGRAHRQVALLLHGLAAERVADSSFWFGLLHSIHALRTASVSPAAVWVNIYERLLPYAAQRPLAECFAPPEARASEGVAEGPQPSSPTADARKAPRPRYRPLPQSGHHRNWICVLEALRAALSMSPAHDAADGGRLELLVEHALLRRVRAGLAASRALPRSERLFVRGACCQLATSLGIALATACGTGGDDDGPQDRPCSDSARASASPAEMEVMTSDAAAAFALLEALDASGAQLLPPKVRLADGSGEGKRLDGGALASGSDVFPFFECMRRDAAAIEAAAGTAAKPPIIRPVALTAVPESVSCYEDACDALRQCVATCTMLANQAATLPNSYGLRVALISHLVNRVLPLPLPTNHPRRADFCFWAAAPGLRAANRRATAEAGGRSKMRAEVHTEVLSMLRALARHFTTASLSISPSRELDAIRVITAATIAAISDAVMRVGAAVSPSVASLHYAGEASGPLSPFGFNPLPYLAKETATMAQTDPALALVRTSVLEYFAAQAEWLLPEHTIFQFDRSMSFGDADGRYVEQLALQVGLPTAAALLPRYLSGEEPELMDQQPEVGMLRCRTGVLEPADLLTGCPCAPSCSPRAARCPPAPCAPSTAAMLFSSSLPCAPLSPMLCPRRAPGARATPRCAGSTPWTRACLCAPLATRPSRAVPTTMAARQHPLASLFPSGNGGASRIAHVRRPAPPNRPRYCARPLPTSSRRPARSRLNSTCSTCASCLILGAP